MTVYEKIGADTDRSAAAPAENGAQSWRRMIWEDTGATGTKVAIWIAEPGIYPYPARPINETFVVMEGTADCKVGEGDLRRIGPGDIVTVPLKTPIWLEVLTPFRKFALVVPKD